MSGQETVRTGRPPKEGATTALLSAARELVSIHGYEKVTVQMIADHAGVGRQAAYRRWSSKANLVLDAYLEMAEEFSEPSAGTVMEQLEALLNQFFLGMTKHGAALRSLIAAAQSDTQFRDEFNRQFVDSRNVVIRELLARGVQRGEMSDSVDIDLTVELIRGAFWLRLLLGKPLDRQFARSLASAVIRAPIASDDNGTA